MVKVPQLKRKRQIGAVKDGRVTVSAQEARMRSFKGFYPGHVALAEHLGVPISFPDRRREGPRKVRANLPDGSSVEVTVPGRGKGTIKGRRR